MDPGIEILLKLAAVLFLVGLNGFFVAAEFALVKIRDSQLSPLVDNGWRRARLARSILNNLDPYLSACQLGITLASLALGWIGEPAFVALLQPLLFWIGVQSEALQHGIAFFVGYTLITFLHITVGEQAPKFLAIKRPLPSSLWVAYPLLWFYRIAYPFIWVLNVASLRILEWIGVEPGEEHQSDHSEEELRLLLGSQGAGQGGASLRRNLVLNAFDLRRRIARDVMTPRNEIAVLNTQHAIADCLRVAEQTRFSRFPLAEQGNLDSTLGVVHYKDLMARRDIAQKGRDLRAVCRPLIYVPPTARLEGLLQRFLDRKLHLAIVIDEYGGTLGLVTLENILEELVGQIQDEFDHEQPKMIPLPDGSWEIDGTLPLFEFEELTGEKLATGDVATVSGWLTQRLGGFPKKGDEVSVGDSKVQVLEADHSRVIRARWGQPFVLHKDTKSTK